MPVSLYCFCLVSLLHNSHARVNGHEENILYSGLLQSVFTGQHWCCHHSRTLHWCILGEFIWYEEIFPIVLCVCHVIILSCDVRVDEQIGYRGLFYPGWIKIFSSLLNSNLLPIPLLISNLPFT